MVTWSGLSRGRVGRGSAHLSMEPLVVPYNPADLVSDIRRQTVPRSDKLAQAEIITGNVQTGGSGVDASCLLSGNLWILDRGCNSRRLHFF
jgi:hypothetical protein